jgi:hypothetical protein
MMLQGKRLPTKEEARTGRFVSPTDHKQDDQYARDGDLHHLYYNVAIQNPQSSETLINAQFLAALTDTLVFQPERFEFAIVRFSVPLQAMPMFFFQDYYQTQCTTMAGSSTVAINVTPSSLNSAYAASIQIGSLVISPGFVMPGSTITSVNIGAGTFVMSQNATASSPSALLNINYSPFSVTLDYASANPQQVYLALNATTQRVTIGAYDFSSQPIQSIQQLIQMYNIALASASAALVTATSSAYNPDFPPFFVFNSNTQLVSLIVDPRYYQPEVPGRARIFCNSAAYHSHFFQFDGVYNGENTLNDEDFQFFISSIDGAAQSLSTTYAATIPNAGNGITNVTGASLLAPVGALITGPYIAVPSVITASTQGNTANSTITLSANTTSTAAYNNVPITVTIAILAVAEQSPSVGMWSQLDALVFTSSTLPIRGEVIQPVRFNSSGVPNAQDGSPTTSGEYATQTILTDFYITKTADARDSPVVQYFPQGPLRWVDLMQSGPIRVFDMNIYAQYRNLQNVLVQIPPQALCQAKALIRPKGTTVTSN